MKMEQNVPKRRRVKFRRQRITQKKTYNTYLFISNMTVQRGMKHYGPMICS